MTTITTEQARARFTTLPPTLQDAVFSEQTAEIIATTIEKFHLSEDRAEDIPTLVGWVLLGFLHIEDLAHEIEIAARVPKPLAKEIADSLTIKIFEPLRGELAKFHAPVPDAMTGIATAPVRVSIEGMSSAPKIIGETTFIATPGSQKNVIIGPKVVQEIRPATPGAPSNSSTTTPLASNIGKPIPHFDPKPNIGGAMANSAALVQKPKSNGEFARLATQQSSGQPPMPTTPTIKPLVPVKPLAPIIPTTPKLGTTPMPATPTPAAPTTPAAPKPMILQNSSLPKPIQNAPSFNNSQKSVDILAGKKMPVPLATKPAMIEIGGAQKTAAPASNTTPTQPSTPEIGRHITEITAAPATSPSPQLAMQSQPKFQPQPPASMPAPAPTSTPIKPIGLTPIQTTQKPVMMPISMPTSPISPTTPKPPQMTQVGGEKIIVKDFKEGEK